MIEQLYKRLALFATQFVNTFISILKVLLKSKFRLKLPPAQGERCVVLANGPSLKQSFQKYSELFKQTPLICVNTFALAPEFEQFKPRYYIFIDTIFWWGENEATRATYKAMIEKVDWKLYLLVPQFALNSRIFKELKEKNPNIVVCPYNYTVFKGFPSVAQWFYKKNLAMPQSWNVTIAALFLGINMGYKEVFLVGADHTWHENLHMSKDNILHTKVPHFWENEEVINYTPLWKPKPFENQTQKAHEFFDIWSRTFYGYVLLSNYAKEQHCKIYNASEVSFIDAFERRNL
jgi:hypothetical protein